jgi:signal transduction histidine kinase
MARKCFMCGREVTEGILCEKCDKPRKKPAPAKQSVKETAAPPPVTPPAPPPPPVAAEPSQASPKSSQPRRQAATAPQLEDDPFPIAPVVQFPVESASPAVTSVVNLLVASGVPAVLVGPDRAVKFVSDEARRVFDATASELSTVAAIEQRSGLRIGELSVPATSGVTIGKRNFVFTLVPMSGGASGAALIFRPSDPLNEAHASFVTYVRETVLDPLRSLRDSLRAAAESGGGHVISVSAAGIEQVLSALELAPGIEESSSAARPVPSVSDVVRNVAERFRAFADLKGIRLDIDVQELGETFTSHEQLAEALAILMENALHYVPASGQVVIGVRWMEHKGKPLLLFFVMDNGPVVPEAMRQAIFEPGFSWNPAAPERTGRALFKTREFAIAHSGSVWVESKTGKACTFFLRVRPDGIR